MFWKDIIFCGIWMMKRNKHLLLFLMICILCVTGFAFRKVKVITDNGKPLIDLNEQLVNREILYPEDNEDETPAVDTTEEDAVRSWGIYIEYDRVSFLSKKYIYTGHDGTEEERLVSMDAGEVDENGNLLSFEEALSDAMKDYKDVSQNDVFVIRDEYGEYYTEQFVLKCIEKYADDSRIRFESSFR